MNIQHSISATSELCNFLTSSADIALIQEPYSISNKIRGFKNNYILLYSENDHPYSAIVISKKELPILFHRDVSNKYICCAEIGNSNSPIVLISIYCPPSIEIDIPLNALEIILHKFKHKKIIIAGDFNAHSQVWNEGVEDARGQQVLDFMCSNGLHLHNLYGVKTFESAAGHSCIDLTLTNDLGLELLREWDVVDVDSLSDHKYIGFTLLNELSEVNVRENYAFGKADWNLFSNTLKKSCKLQHYGVTNKTEANVFISRFLSLINFACELSIPIQQRKHRSVAWWTRELTILRKENNRLRRHYQRTRDPVLRDIRKQEYFTKQSQYKSEIKLSKERSWRKYCTECSRNPWGFVYKMCCNKLKSNSGFSNIKVNDVYTTNLEETLEVLMNKFFPLDVLHEDTAFQKSIRNYLQLSYIETSDDPPFTIAEVDQVITNLTKGKAPGHDKITTEIVKKIFSVCPDELTDLYNICLKHGIFPASWKMAVVVVIPKSENRDPGDINSYRPISLLPILGKVLDKLMINRINWHIEHHNVLSEYQFGFRKNRNSEDAISLLVNHIQNFLGRNKYAVAISLDITGAFDHAWWPLILNKLKQIKCPKNLYNLAQDYFNERYAKLEVGAISVRRNVTRGCPQGSVSAPTFWNILYNDLLKLEKGADVINIAFADDCILLFPANSRQEIETKGTALLQVVNNWGKEYRLSFNPKKTKCMVFTPPRSKTDLYRRTPVIKMENQSISVVKSFKYLGVIIDNKLLWKDHILMIKTKIIKLFNALAAITRSKWGLDFRSLKLIYHSVFVSIVTYACNVWGHTVNKLYIQKLLFSAQRMAALRMTKAYRTTSFDALCVLAGILPVDLLVKERMVHYNLRKGRTVHIGNITYEQGTYERKLSSLHLDSPWNRFGIQISINELRYDYNIFTDGSKSLSGVGSAFVVYSSEEVEIFNFQMKLHPKCSIFQAELLALLESIKWCASQERTKKILIQSDSKSAINAVTITESLHPIVWSIQTLLHSIGRKNNIYIQWIKAHSGIPGNERADELAKNAALNDEESQYNIIPLSAIKCELLQHFISVWQNRWNSSTAGRLTYEFFPNIQERLRNTSLCIDFFSCQIFTGHGKFQSYLHRFNLCASPICECGTSDESSNHVLLECIRFSTERIPLEMTARILGFSWPCRLHFLANIPELLEKLLKLFRTIHPLL